MDLKQAGFRAAPIGIDILLHLDFKVEVIVSVEISYSS
jgi:hypothetical protein